MNSVTKHFPSSAKRWKMYTKVFIPIILGSTLFALNGVVDNFMVGQIEQGQAALGAINSWGNILIGWFIGVAASGSVLAGQFYFSKNYKVAKEVARYRFYLSIIPAVCLAIVAWTAPDLLTKVFAAKLPDNPQLQQIRTQELIFEHARAYAKIIAIQWILISISFNLGNQLREIGFGFYTMIWGIGTLIANITLNSVLMYGFHMGVEGAAWASVAGRLVAISSGITILIAKKIEIGFKPWTILSVSLETRKLFWKRWVYVLSIFTVMFFITFRTYFYSNMYPNNASLGKGVTGLGVIALTGALMNIFTTTFAALSSMSSRFVGSELGKGNIKQAKINADELKGFSTTMSAAMAFIMAIFAICVPYMDFLAKTTPDFDGHAQLLQVSHSLFVICMYYPFWIWFSASYRLGNAGGKGAYFSIVDWLVSGLQLAWLSVMSVYIISGWDFAEKNLWVMYAIFFTSDGFKMIFIEIHYYKYKWLNRLTKKEAAGQEAKAQDQAELPSNTRRS